MEVLLLAGIIGAAALYLLRRSTRASSGAPAPPSPGALSPAAPQGQPATLPPGVTATWSRTDLERLAEEIAKEERYGRAQLVKAIVSVESSWRVRAINTGDRPPSVGLMGLKVPTARYYVPHADSITALYDPFTNLRAGIRFLVDLERKWLAQYGLDGVIQMYNLGETRFRGGERSSGYLQRVKAQLPSALPSP